MPFFKTKMLPGGRITISGPLRNKLNFKVGDELILLYKDGDLLITTPEKNLQNVQELIKQARSNLSEINTFGGNKAANRAGEDNV